MREVNMVRQVVDADPRNRLLSFPVCDQLLDTRAVVMRARGRVTARNVTARTNLHWRDTGIDGLVRRIMAVHARDVVRRAGVLVVWEGYRLRWRRFQGAIL